MNSLRKSSANRNSSAARVARDGSSSALRKAGQ